MTPQTITAEQQPARWSLIGEAAGIVIFAFFLLVASNALEWLAGTQHLPLRPFQAEAACLIAGVAILAGKMWRFRPGAIVEAVRPAIPVFVPLGLLALWLLARTGRPHSLSLALWITANTALGVIFCAFARRFGGTTSVRCAALATLALQIITISIDVVWPGTFSIVTERAAGLAGNPNDGAALVAFLAALALPSRESRPAAADTRLLLVATAAVFFTFSRSGLILMAAVWAAYAWSARSSGTSSILRTLRNDRLFLILYAGVVTGLIVFGALLRTPGSSAMLDERFAIGAAPATEAEFAAANTSGSISAPHGSFHTDSGSVRLLAARFFLGKVLAAPWDGYGTGYSMSFVVGPHNMLLALWADGGLGALALYIGAGIFLLIVARQRSSPCLMALTLVAGLDSLFSHTLLVDPEFVIMLGAAMGMVPNHDRDGINTAV